MPVDGDEGKTKQELDESGKYLRRAYNLANFGTLTSLISTGAYFAEQRFMEAKKLPKRLVDVTIGAIGVGIAGVLASYYYSLKAGRIALEGEERLSKHHAQADSPAAIPEPAAPKTWVEKQAERPELSRQSPG
jgi:hypothetical protein